ncbi:MAG: hypothetical protein JO019_01750 [Candidatus Kaiserbacteria bacterium]|nr:hypothetical protein [Candidatus Kaiserbacteria bacterium]
MEERFVAVLALSILLGGVADYIQTLTKYIVWGWTTHAILVGAANTVWLIVVTYISTTAALAFYNHASVSHVADWKPRLFPTFLIALLLFYIGFAVGLALIIVPGIIFGMTFSFFTYAIVGDRMSIRDAYRYSAHLTKGQRFRLFWMTLVIVLIVMLIEFVAGFIFGFWSAALHLGLNEALLGAVMQFVATACTLWLTLVYADLYAQLKAAKA